MKSNTARVFVCLFVCLFVFVLPDTLLSLLWTRSSTKEWQLALLMARLEVVKRM